MTLTAYPQHYEIKSVEKDHLIVDTYVGGQIIYEERDLLDEKTGQPMIDKETGKKLVEKVELGTYGLWDKDDPSNKNLKLFLNRKKINGLFTEGDTRCLRWAKRMEQKGTWDKVTKSYPGIQNVSELACHLLSMRMSKSINKGETIPAVIAEGESISFKE